jgi:hypothetical protein
MSSHAIWLPMSGGKGIAYTFIQFKVSDLSTILISTISVVNFTIAMVNLTKKLFDIICPCGFG